MSKSTIRQKLWTIRGKDNFSEALDKDRQKVDPTVVSSPPLVRSLDLREDKNIKVLPGAI